MFCVHGRLEAASLAVTAVRMNGPQVVEDSSSVYHPLQRFHGWFVLRLCRWRRQRTCSASTSSRAGFSFGRGRLILHIYEHIILAVHGNHLELLLPAVDGAAHLTVDARLLFLRARFECSECLDAHIKIVLGHEDNVRRRSALQRLIQFLLEQPSEFPHLRRYRHFPQKTSCRVTRVKSTLTQCLIKKNQEIGVYSKNILQGSPKVMILENVWPRSTPSADRLTSHLMTNLQIESVATRSVTYRPLATGTGTLTC